MKFENIKSDGCALKVIYQWHLKTNSSKFFLTEDALNLCAKAVYQNAKRTNNTISRIVLEKIINSHAAVSLHGLSA